MFGFSIALLSTVVKLEQSLHVDQRDRGWSNRTSYAYTQHCRSLQTTLGQARITLGQAVRYFRSRSTSTPWPANCIWHTNPFATLERSVNR